MVCKDQLHVCEHAWSTGLFTNNVPCNNLLAKKNMRYSLKKTISSKPM